MFKLDFAKLSEWRLHSVSKAYLPQELQSCTHVWIRVNRVRQALEAPYSGPFEVLHRYPKYFTVKTATGKTSNVSIDRLKPVFQKTTASKTEKSIQENCTNTENSDNTNTSATSSEPSSSDKQSDTDSAEVEAKRDKTAETQSNTLTDPVIRTSSSGRKIRFNLNNEYVYF